MASGFLEYDGVDVSALPEHARDGKTGDRLTFLPAGLLHVQGGRATFARWSDVLGTREHDGAVYVLVPRRPPKAPWIRVDATILGADGGSVSSFAARLRERLAGGGYRDAVVRRRQGLSTNELMRKVRAREDVPGALEVPSTITLGGKYPRLWLGQLGAFALGSFLGYVVLFAAMLAVALANEPMLLPLVQVLAYVSVFGGMLTGAYGARELTKRWKAQVDATRPRQRVLVLAPDGCVVGFRTGVRALSWAQVGSFEAGLTRPSDERGLVVRGHDGEVLGDLAEGWLEAPLELVVAIAETYRKAAKGARERRVRVAVDGDEAQPAEVEVAAERPREQGQVL